VGRLTIEARFAPVWRARNPPVESDTAARVVQITIDVRAPKKASA